MSKFGGRGYGMCILFVIIGAILGDILGEVLKNVPSLAGVHTRRSWNTRSFSSIQPLPSSSCEDNA